MPVKKAESLSHSSLLVLLGPHKGFGHLQTEARHVCHQPQRLGYADLRQNVRTHFDAELKGKLRRLARFFTAILELPEERNTNDTSQNEHQRSVAATEGHLNQYLLSSAACSTAIRCGASGT